MSICVVGISGGVDSSVALFLMKRAGFHVQAVYMKSWQDDEREDCVALKDCEYAMQVCEILDVPFNTIDLIQAYKNRVFKSFLSDYESGRTPNPDILCNREIKFSACIDFLKETMSQSFVFATGHYAKIEKKGDLYFLKKGIDPKKDQSYFLHGLNQSQLGFSKFPLGNLKKNEVRKFAKELGFSTHNRQDSTGICFIGEQSMINFLSQYLPTRTGDIVTDTGKKIGEHPGICFFTIGQRKGLGIGGLNNFSESPWYVADKDPKTNQLIVVQGHAHSCLYHNTLEANQLNWISGYSPKKSHLKAKIRYRQLDQDCHLEYQDDKVRVYFKKPQWAVSPGQFVVFYDQDVCLGGGVIKSRLNV